MTTHSPIIEFTGSHPVPYVGERRLFADVLRANTGRVALLGVMSNRAVARQCAHQVRNGIERMHMFGPAGSFEVHTKTMFGATYIYVCHVGEGE